MSDNTFLTKGRYLENLKKALKAGLAGLRLVSWMTDCRVLPSMSSADCTCGALSPQSWIVYLPLATMSFGAVNVIRDVVWLVDLRTLLLRQSEHDLE